MKFCQYCGKELNEEQVVCLGCGREVPKMPNKIKHNGYYVSTSIIMIVVSACLLIAGLNTEYMEEYSEIYDNLILVFAGPGLLGLTGAILCLVGKKNKVLLIASAVCYIIAAAINFVAIETVSLFAIMACIFAGFNIGFAVKMD